MTFGEPDAVLRRRTGEGVGDDDLAGLIEVHEVLRCERLQRAVGVEAEPLGGLACLLPGRTTARGEATKHPEVERALAGSEPRVPPIIPPP